MDQIIRIGMDTSKNVFQLHGVNADEAPVLRKKLRRQDLITFFAKLSPTVVALEACGGSHYWARLLQSLVQQVKLIAPQLAKPYVKRGKNDAADAEVICEAMSRPTMRFVVLVGVVVEDSSSGRILMRQHLPVRSGAQQIDDRIDDAPQRVRLPPSGRMAARDQGLEQRPFGIGEVTGLRTDSHGMGSSNIKQPASVAAAQHRTYGESMTCIER
jgi:transposase